MTETISEKLTQKIEKSRQLQGTNFNVISTVKHDQNNSIEQELSSMLSHYKYKVRSSRVSLSFPEGDGIDPVIKMMNLTTIMAQMHPIAEGDVTVMPAISMYKTGITRSFCASCLMIQSWVSISTLLDEFGNICYYASEVAQKLGVKVTVTVDIPGESLMITLN